LVEHSTVGYTFNREVLEMATGTTIGGKETKAKTKRKSIVLTETQEILADPETMVSLRRGAQEAEEGKSIPLSQVKKELGL